MRCSARNFWTGTDNRPAVKNSHHRSPISGRGALRSRASNPAPSKNKKENLAILLSFATLERKTELALALCASDGRDPLSTLPAPERGALRSRGHRIRLPEKQKGESQDSPFFCHSGAENGFPTQAYSSFTISALHEVFSSRVTPVMRSSCTRLHPNAFDKDNGKLHLIQAKIGTDTIL